MAHLKENTFPFLYIIMWIVVYFVYCMLSKHASTRDLHLQFCVNLRTSSDLVSVLCNHSGYHISLLQGVE